jgi:hypothetical protein
VIELGALDLERPGRRLEALDEGCPVVVGEGRDVGGDLPCGLGKAWPPRPASGTLMPAAPASCMKTRREIGF